MQLIGLCINLIDSIAGGTLVDEMKHNTRTLYDGGLLINQNQSHAEYMDCRLFTAVCSCV